MLAESDGSALSMLKTLFDSSSAEPALPARQYHPERTVAVPESPAFSTDLYAKLQPRLEPGARLARTALDGLGLVLELLRL